MTTQVTIRREVERLKEAVVSRPRDRVWVVFWCPPDGEGDPEDYVECVEMYSGKKFKCKRREYKERIEEGLNKRIEG